MCAIPQLISAPLNPKTISLLNDESEQSRRSGVKRVTFILPNKKSLNTV